MNIYYMGKNLTESEFPIVVWNTRIPRNIKGVTQCPQEEYENRPRGWGEPEGGGGPDAWATIVNNTDSARRDTFPREVAPV